MAPVFAQLHLASNVERGYFPEKGAGFQTFAVSEGLVGTADLRLLEDISAYYEVAPDRRSSGDLPVKEACFRLPSGAVAVGRTVDWGSSGTGRSGNYLAQHWVLAEPDYLRLGANPFSLLESCRPEEDGLDLTPRRLDPLALNAPLPELPLLAETESAFSGLPEKWIGAWISAALGSSEKPALLIGPEARSRRLLEALYRALPPAQRAQLTFSTHFSRACDHLRRHFRLAAVRTGAEGPAQRQPYLTFDLDARTVRPEAEAPAGGAYVRWLAETLAQARWEEIERVRTGISADRETAPGPLPPPALAAVADLAPERVAQFLSGDPVQVSELLKRLPDPKPLVDRLLAEADPRSLCGSGTGEMRSACLGALRSAASPAVWKSWERRHAGDPLLKDLPRAGWAFWRR